MMADGWVAFASGRCVETAVEAVAGYCGGYPKVSFAQDGTALEVRCSVDAGYPPDGQVFFEYWVGGSMTSGTAQSVWLGSCTLPVGEFALSTEDGGIVAGAIVAVWLSAWAFRAVRSAVA